jgi:peptidyl-tRNA hydrolase, PTH1 family
LWLVVGLGNPGRRYSRTRHNVGFMVAGEIARRYGIEFITRESYAIGKGSGEGKSLILLEPLTFMNRSGLAVKDVLRRCTAPPEQVIVIQDDIDMETGKLKIRKNGSSGGHKGVESVIQTLATRDFIRVKIGVGREEGIPVEEYVLRPFRKDETSLIKEAIVRAADAVGVIMEHGVEKAMNLFN